jgi:hypothetical protein
MYILIVVGIAPLVCAITCNILLMMNLRKTRTRVTPVRDINQAGNQILRRRDRDMLRMLLVEIIIYTSTL